MARQGFTITGGLTFERVRDELYNSYSFSKWQKHFAESAEVAYRKAYELCPRDSGWMQGQLKLIPAGEHNFILECNADYASFNEFGWYGIPPVPDPPQMEFYKGGYRPFMRIGILEGEIYLVRVIEKEVAKKHKFAHI